MSRFRWGIERISQYHNTQLITSWAEEGDGTPSDVKLDPLRDTTRQLEMYRRKEIAQIIKETPIFVSVF